MDNQQPQATSQTEADGFLQAPPLREDWGGDGSNRMALSGRSTAISPEYLPRQYQFFDTSTVTEDPQWRAKGMPASVMPVSRRLLTWYAAGASTSKLKLPPSFEAPGGVFTADLEIFVLAGMIQIGEWQLSKHGYSYIPAGVRVGAWKVVGNHSAEILWMENGPLPLQYKPAQQDAPGARLGDFIPALDSRLLPWGKTDTVQFERAKKKFLRKEQNGSGTWLLAVLPHYDGLYSQIQCYNEEAYCLAGYCDIGDYRFTEGHLGYCPSFCTVPRHNTYDGTLFFVRIDRDLTKTSTVLSYNPVESTNGYR